MTFSRRSKELSESDKRIIRRGYYGIHNKALSEEVLNDLNPREIELYRKKASEMDTADSLWSVLGWCVGLGAIIIFIGFSALGWSSNDTTNGTQPSTPDPINTTEAIEFEATAPEPPDIDIPVNLPDPFVVYPGQEAWIQAGTFPGANCSVVVRYRSGPSQARGLYPKTADSNGEVRWDWFIGTNTSYGDWPIDVTCTLGEQSGSSRTYIYVR